MKSLKTTLTLFFVFGFTLTNCWKDNDCNCPPNYGTYFDINGIQSIVHHEKIPNTNSAPPLPNGATLDFENYYGFRLRFSSDFYSFQQSTKPCLFSGGSLYACSCTYSGESGSQTEHYKNITVITLNDFDSSHQKLDTLNDIISINLKPLEDFMAQDTSLITYTDLSFGLNKEPEIDKEFVVKVIVKLSTGEVYEKVSPLVNFK